jgi:hypothetical protein
MTSETTLNRALNNPGCQSAAAFLATAGLMTLGFGFMSHKFVLIVSGGAGIACAAIFGALKIGQQVKIAKFRNQTVVTPYTPGEGIRKIGTFQANIAGIDNAITTVDPRAKGNVTIHTGPGPKNTVVFYGETAASRTKDEDL